MALSAGVVLKGVEDAELRRSEADRVPRDGVRLFLCQGQCALQERGNLVLLARLRFNAGQNPHFHLVPLLRCENAPRSQLRLRASEYADRSIRVPPRPQWPGACRAERSTSR